jgi:hypothetical protein
MLEKTLCERIAIVFIKIVHGLLEILSLDVEESISRIISFKQGDRSAIILLNAINQLNTECKTSSNVARNDADYQLDTKYFP